MDIDECADFAGVPLLASLREKLRVQMDGIKTISNDLSSIERMIQELMQKREDKMYEIEDRKAEAEITQQQVNECRRESYMRLESLKKRYNVVGSSVSLFDLLPSELYVHIFKFLSTKDLCKSAMLTSHRFHILSLSDSLWSSLFRLTWGEIDDRACATCRYLAPPPAPGSKEAVAEIVRRREKEKETEEQKEKEREREKKKRMSDGDVDMGMNELVTGLEKINVSWLEGYKHRKELERNWATAKCSINVLHGHTDWVTCLVSVDDLLFSGSFDSSIKIWNLRTNECTVTLTGHTAGVNAIDISGDLLVSASLDCTLRVWSMTTKTCTAVLEGHTDQVSHVNFITPRPSSSSSSSISSSSLSSLSSLSHVVVTGSLDGTLRVWDVKTAKCLHVLEGHTTGITSMTTCHQYAASGSVDGSIVVWDCLSGRRILSLSGHTDRVTGLQFDFSSSRLVSCSWDFTARVWDLKTGVCTQVLQGHVFRIRCLSFKDNILVTGSWDSDVKVWDLSSGSCVRTLSGHSNYVWGCELISKGQIALSSSWDKTVRVWDSRSGRLLSTLDHDSEVLCLHASSHRIIGASKEIKIWDFSK